MAVCRPEALQFPLVSGLSGLSSVFLMSITVVFARGREKLRRKGMRMALVRGDQR